MPIIAHATAEKIIREGTNNRLRVGADASSYLGRVLDEIGMEISRKAGELAEHDGRKTVKEEDIIKALRIGFSEDLLAKTALQRARTSKR